MPARNGSFWSRRFDRWLWLEQMRQRFDLAIEVLDQELECTLEGPSSGPLGAKLRAAAGNRGEPAVRLAAASAIETGTSRFVTAYGLRVRVVPLLGDGERVPSAVLLIADSLPDPAAPGAASVIDHRLDAISHWLAPAIEATLDMMMQDRAHAQSAERVAGVMEIVGAFQNLDDDDEIIQRMMDAAGLWFAAGARAYRLDAAGVFVLEACGPGTDLRSIPSELAGAIVNDREQPFRIGSPGELTAIGWDRPPGETLFVPIAIHDSTEWLIAVSVPEAAEEPALAFLGRVIGLMIENLEARTRARLQQQLATVLCLRDAPFDSAARIGLEILALEASASSIHLRVVDEARRVPELAVEWRRSEPDYAAPPAADASLQQLQLSDRSSGVDIVLTLRRSGRQFTARAHRLGQAAVEMYGLWMSGILTSHADLHEAAAGSRVSALVGRLKSQLDPAGHLKIGGAVAVVFPEPSPPTGPQLDEAMQVLQDHVRSSDIVGLVEPFGAGVLLPNASASVASALVGRLAGAVRQRGLGKVRIGAATFAPFSEVPEALVLKASARARGGDELGAAES